LELEVKEEKLVENPERREKQKERKDEESAKLKEEERVADKYII
jgi:hypothetical protein